MPFDLLLAGVVAVFGLFGLLSGALNQLRNWIGLLLAAAAARPLAAKLTPLAAPRLGAPPAAVNVGLSLVLFLLLYLIGMLTARAVLRRLFPDSQGGKGDQAFGFGLGAGKGAFLIYVLLSLLVFFEKPLTKSLGALPAPVRESRAVAFVRRHDLFNAVPVPVLAQVEKLADAAKDPAGLKGLENQPELRRLLDDPQLKSALRDDALSQALKSGDLSALKNDPRLKALLNDPRLAAPPASAPPLSGAQ